MPSAPSTASARRWAVPPLAAVALCLATGAAIASVGAVSVSLWLFMAGSLLSGAGMLHVLEARRLVSLHALASTLLLGLGVAALGGARATVPPQPAHHVSHHLTGPDRPQGLRGTVRTVEPSARWTRLSVDLLRAEGSHGWHARTGRIQVTLDTSASRGLTLCVGHRVHLQGQLQPLPTRRNPADPPLGAWLSRQGIDAQMWIRQRGSVHVVGGRCRPSALHTMRSWTRYAIQRAVPTPGARSLLHALMLGDRSGLDPAVRSAFRMTGLAHLLAISGLHIMLVGLTVYRLGRPLLQRLGLSWRRAEHVAAATAISLLSGYVALAGAPASAVRALLMMTLWIGGSLLQRPTQPLNLLGAAATVLLVADPAVLFDVGAQLSFSAVGGLIVLVGPVQRRLQAWGPSWRGRRYLEGSLVASAVATMATTPVLLHHLGGVPLGGIVLNLVALPLVSAALMAGFVAVATSPWTWLSEVAGRAAAVGLDTLIHLLDTVAPWFERVYVTGGPVPVLVLVVAVLGLVILREHLHPHTRGRCLLLMLVLTNVQLWRTVWSGTEQPALTLLFFDVGQGDAALVQFPNGRHLLVDTGARSPWSDHGRQTIVPHLKRAGIRKLEGVMITHAHRDHMGGLPSVLRHVEVGAVWHNAQVHDSALYGEARHVADSLGVPWIRLKAGDHLRVDPTVLTQILGPSKALTETGSANEASVVLRLRHGQMRALLLGDAEAEAEGLLLDHYPALLESEVVKVGHYGSATSSTWPLVRAARSSFATPFLAVVSVAASNHYGLPNQDVLTRWQSSGASVLQTSQAGAVEVRMERSSVRWHGFK